MHFYETLWKKTALELALKHASPDTRTLLDFGCGRGETLDIFGRAGFEATGTDPDPECIRLASEHGLAVPLNSGNPVGQFGADSFDIVTCFHVLEHVESPLRTLRAISSIARKFVILAVPNLRYLHRITEREFDLTQINEGHLQSWDHWHLRNLAERGCGLELREWGSDATLLPLLSDVAVKLLGQRGAIRLETGLFRRLFPYHCISVLGIFNAGKQSAPDGKNAPS